MKLKKKPSVLEDESCFDEKVQVKSHKLCLNFLSMENL